MILASVFLLKFETGCGALTVCLALPIIDFRWLRKKALTSGLRKKKRSLLHISWFEKAQFLIIIVKLNEKS